MKIDLLMGGKRMLGTRDTWLQLWFLHKKIIARDGAKKRSEDEHDTRWDANGSFR